MNAAVAIEKDSVNVPEPGRAFEKNTETIRRLIWLYLVLWLIEGGLRRWVLPGLATPLLLIRDPLVIAIYGLAISKNLFPVNSFITIGALLAALSFINAMLLGHGNPLVALYGMRCDFLHVPLIFIMAKVLRQKHLVSLAKVAVCVAIPYTALLVTQFYEPQDAWVNHGTGDSTDGAGYSGALGHFRPPGTFTFITGPAELYPIFTACWCMLVLLNRIPAWLTILSGAAIMTAIPVSISRLLFINVAIVAAAGVFALIVGRRFSLGMLLRVGIIVIVLPAVAARIPAFQDGMEAFSSRWEASTTDDGGIQGSIIGRTMEDLFGKFDGAPLSAFGTGFSTNVGQKLLTGDVGFGASEGEWGRLLYDNGLILGTMFVAYRILLAGYIVFVALKALKRGSPQAIVFASAGCMLILNGQWGQASTLGGAMIVGGLTLAAAAMGDRSAAPKIKARKDRLSERIKRHRLTNATT
jgi:hypothetical protein